MGATATAVLGQANAGAGSAGGGVNCQANQNGPVAANTLLSPQSMAIQNGYLAVDDDQNNRVLFFTLPVVTNQAASYVFGQPGFITNATGAASTTAIKFSRGLVFAGTAMYAMDFGYNRLLIFQLPYTP